MPRGPKSPTGMLPSTSAFKRELGRLNHFVWPAAGALWNLRWQVQGFLQVVPKASSKELGGRFLLGSGLQERVDFRRSCLIDSWRDQQGLLAEMALLALFSLYEGWLEESQTALLRKRSSNLEWPSKSVGLRFNSSGKPIEGIGEELEKINAGTSLLMTSAFGTSAKQSPRYMRAGLDNLMIAYRYWKEVRNAIVHRGRKVTNELTSAQAKYAGVQASSVGLTTVEMLGINDTDGKPRQLVVGDTVELSLYAAFNFANIINNLVVTLDFLLASSPAGEELFLTRLREQIGWNDPANRTVKRLRWALHRMDHPEAATMETLLADVVLAFK